MKLTELQEKLLRSLSRSGWRKAPLRTKAATILSLNERGLIVMTLSLATAYPGWRYADLPLKLTDAGQKARAKLKRESSLPSSAYSLHPGPGDDEGRVIIVTKAERGFRFVPDYDSSPKKRRRGIVTRLNKRAGVTKREANQLVAASMRGV